MLEFHFNPFPILETERLTLRQMTEVDIPTIFILRTDHEIIKYIDRIPPTTYAEIKSFLERVNDDIRNIQGITWGMYLKGSSDLIGYLGFWRMTPEHYRAEIGYALLSSHWRKGIMTEGINAILDYGFTKMNLHSIEANINPSNHASRAILEKINFKKEAYFRENYYFNGQFLDSEIFSLIRSDYLASN